MLKLILLLVALCVIESSAQNKITLDDILSGKYSSRGWGGTWVEGERVQLVQSGNVVRYNPATNVTQVYFDGSGFSDNDLYPGRSFSFSQNEQAVLVRHSLKSLWRHSYTAKYHVFSNITRQTIELKPRNFDGHPELQLVQWSTQGNALMYVYNGNIYYRSDATNAGSDIPLTTSGNANTLGTISNGHTDWVYEEEMFGSNLAAWFSPDGSHLTYIEFDDRQVEEFLYPMYGEAAGRNENNSYPRWTHIRYPKPGTTNPTLIVYVQSLQALVPRRITLGGAEPGTLYYIATIKWVSNTQFLVVYLDRLQQRSTWYRCDVTQGGGGGQNIPCQHVYSFFEPTGWIDVSSPVVSADGNRFLTTKMADVQGAVDYKHIVMVDMTTGTPRRITNERYSVDSILKWDETRRLIYFTATGLSFNGPDPSQTQVYRINDTQLDVNASCITCELRTSNNELCLQNSMSFSLSAENAIHTCSGPNVPETVVRSRGDDVWNITRVMEANAQLRADLQNVAVPRRIDYTIPPTVNTSLPTRAMLFVPSDFDENKKYPLFIDVYGGPGSQNVRRGFSISWGSSLVSNHSIIYGYIDGRGSARQTGKHLFELREKLGTAEIEDQINAVKWLISQHSYIDASKTAIWGWSYGGYATAMALGRDTENVFKCGISVAPVTSWLYYDTIYTERYMNEPRLNRAGYAAGDVTNLTRIESIKTHKFFLVHGNADDNVHYQQSMILARALEQNDVMFEQLSYPDEDHSIAGPGMRRHLYHSLEKFLFRECFPADSVNNNQNSAPKVTTIPIVSLLLGLMPLVLTQIIRF